MKQCSKPMFSLHLFPRAPLTCEPFDVLNLLDLFRRVPADSSSQLQTPLFSTLVRTPFRRLHMTRAACRPQVCVPLPPWAMRAGARETIYFNPSEVNVAIVTCGGLCPGLNDVVQGLVNKLSDYGVPEGHILGIK